MPGLCAGHPRGLQAVEALPCVPEAEALRDDLLGTQPVQRVANGPRRQVRFIDDLLLREQAARLEDFVDQLRGRRKTLDVIRALRMRYDNRTYAISGKNDPSWYVSPHIDILNNS